MCKTQISIALDRKVQDELKKLANEQGLAVSAYVRMLIMQALNEKSAKK